MSNRVLPPTGVFNIYEDPYTRTRLEGQAELVKFIDWQPFPFAMRYQVRFVDDTAGQVVERIIVNVDPEEEFDYLDYLQSVSDGRADCFHLDTAPFVVAQEVIGELQCQTA